MAKKSAKISPTAPAPSSSLRTFSCGMLGVLHFSAPLFFFTNLTRNPYYSQITLLYFLISILGILWVVQNIKDRIISWPNLGVERPLGLFLGFALLSTLFSWWVHPSLRPGIGFEGMRVWVFTFANCVAALYLPYAFLKPFSEDNRASSIWTDVLFAFVWAAMWLGFDSMKNRDPQELMWDPYGALLWALGIGYAFFRARSGRARAVFHLMFAVTVIAGLYAVFQYAGRDVIWSSPVTPYGGRPVSTFGNPNFLSSYLLLTVILSAVLMLTARGREAWGYGLVSLIGALAILSTLTRSTYVGLVFGVLALLYFLKGNARASLMKILGLIALIVLLIAVFPVTPVTKVQSPLARFTEIYTAFQTGDSYGPWHQRLLIWSSAWDMVKERPLVGKGWGCFELFYPFYQGAYLFDPIFVQWRTHANNAHNIVMEIWSQVGTVGLGLALLLFASLLAAGRRVVSSLQDESHALAAGLLAAWIGMVVDNFFGNVSIFFAMPAFLFWWFIGSLLQANPLLVSRPPSWTLKSKLALGFLGAVFLFSGVYYVRRWRQEIFYFQGFKESKNNLIPQSIQTLEAAYRWFPGEVNSNYELGNSYARHAKNFSDKGSAEESRKFIEKAVWAYGEAIRANPGYDEIYFNRGVSLLQTGKRLEGIKDLKTAVLINPLLKSAYGPLSSLFVGDQNWPEALSVLEQAVKAFPRDVDFWNNLGYVYTQVGDDKRALEAIKKALELNPLHKTAWPNFQSLVKKLNVQDSYLQLPGLMTQLADRVARQKFKEAREDAQKLVQLIPNNADVAVSYANILFYLGDVNGSIQEYGRIIKMAPDFDEAHLNLGKIYQSQGDFVRARQSYLRVLDMNRSNTEAASALAQLPKP